MRVGYVQHALDRMRQRQITELDVEHVLRNFTDRQEDVPMNSVRLRGLAPNGRPLKVWIFPKGNSTYDIMVKSAAWEDE